MPRQNTMAFPPVKLIMLAVLLVQAASVSCNEAHGDAHVDVSPDIHVNTNNEQGPHDDFGNGMDPVEAHIASARQKRNVPQDSDQIPLWMPDFE